MMYCTKCHSPRVIRFLDGFGEWRIFCKSCHESISLLKFNQEKNLKKLWEFTEYYKNQPAEMGMI